MIRDEGQGFDGNADPKPAAPENRSATQGRGIYLVRAFMDEVSLQEDGTLVHMKKRPNPQRAL